MRRPTLIPRLPALALLAAAAAVSATPAAAPRAAPAGYPTEVLADYVFACMATNGQTPDALRRCSCSIDQIAARVPFEDYTQAETVLRMQQIPGGDNRATLFRSTPFAQAAVDKLRQAQVEAETRCF